MSAIDESNIDQYKTEHECDEHWELRRKFLLAHKDKFTIDELLCLAQVFTNVEFLGCKYPNETMQTIATLSNEITKEYREKHKNRIKRTFVKASDAASSKAKGNSRSGISDKQENSPKPECSTQSSIRNFQPPSINVKRKHESVLEQNLSEKKKKNEQSSQQHKCKDLVLLEYFNDTPQSILSRAASTFNIDIDWKCDRERDKFLCSFFFNKHKMAEAAGTSLKIAKKEVSIAALKQLQKTYYTIKVTKNLTPTITEDLSMYTESSESKSNKLSNDNIGSKMMKLMGWSGGGLGKSSQGITEPVKVQQQMTREGLGLKVGFYNMHIFKKKCSEVLRNYAHGDIMASDLVFSPNFSNEERAMIHTIAKQIGLKSQSYGPKNQRTLTISRKINPQRLVDELKEVGGFTEKYQLIEPTEKK